MTTIRPLPILVFIFLSLLSAVAPDAFSAERLGKSTLLRIGIASRSPLDMPYFVAQQRGFFRDEGLETEIILMKAIQTVQSLLGGSIEFGTATGTAVSAAVRRSSLFTRSGAQPSTSEPGASSAVEPLLGGLERGQADAAFTRSFSEGGQVDVDELFDVRPLDLDHYLLKTLGFYRLRAQSGAVNLSEGGGSQRVRFETLE